AHRPARTATGEGARVERGRDAAGWEAPPVPIRQQGDALLARALPRCGEPDRRTHHRLPGVVPASVLSPGVHADVVAEGPDRDGLDSRAALPPRYRAARVARAPTRRVPACGRRLTRGVTSSEGCSP